jgi:hypothetical protein
MALDAQRIRISRQRAGQRIERGKRRVGQVRHTARKQDVGGDLHLQPELVATHGDQVGLDQRTQRFLQFISHA